MPEYRQFDICLFLHPLKQPRIISHPTPNYFTTLAPFCGHTEITEEQRRHMSTFVRTDRTNDAVVFDGS